MNKRYTISKQEAALAVYYASFPLRSRAVMRYVDELIEQWRANPLRSEPRIFDFLDSELKRILPNAIWTTAGIGRHQIEFMC